MGIKWPISSKEPLPVEKGCSFPLPSHLVSKESALIWFIFVLFSSTLRVPLTKLFKSIICSTVQSWGGFVRRETGWKWLTFYSWILWWELAIFTILFDTFLPTSLLYFGNGKVLCHSFLLYNFSSCWKVNTIFIWTNLNYFPINQYFFLHVLRLSI